MMELTEVASMVSAALNEAGVDAVLVGGACVSIYSRSKYRSYDLDYVTHANIRKIREVLKQIGFHEKGKYFVKEGCTFYLDFVSPPVAIGEQPITKFDHLGEIKLLTATDCVKDRLAGYYHWDDRQSLEQAIMVAKEQEVDLNEIAKWSKNEGHPDRFQEFKDKLGL